MALRLSTAMVNALASGMSVNEALANGRLYLFTGSPPTNADAVNTGTLLCEFTKSGAAYSTQPTQMAAKVVFAGAGSGGVWTCSAMGIGGSSAATGIQLFGTAVTGASAAALATAVAAAINAYPNPFNITATNPSSGQVNLYVPIQFGALYNGLMLYVNAGAGTTANINANGAGAEDAEVSLALGGATPVALGAAGSTATAGCNWTIATAGVISKEATIWQGTAAATGTAGWFRYVAGGSTYDGVSGTDIRFDGTVATSGGDLTISSTAVAAGSTQTISSLTLAVPQS